MFLSKLILVTIIFTLSASLACADDKPATTETHGYATSTGVIGQNMNGKTNIPAWQLGAGIVVRPTGSGVAPKGDDSHIAVGINGGLAGGAATVQLDTKLDGSNNIYLSLGSDRMGSVGPYVNRAVLPVGVRIDNAKFETLRLMLIPFGMYNDNVNHNNSVGSGLRLEYIAHILDYLDVGIGGEALATTGNAGAKQKGVGFASSLNLYLKANLSQHASIRLETVADIDTAKFNLPKGQVGTGLSDNQHLDLGAMIAF